jgi:Rrf2 family protein
MAATTRFAIGVHAMSLLAARAPGAVHSSDLAAVLKTHPVALRRTLSELSRAGLVRATRGRSGGFTLAKDPSRVTLRDIFEAVEPFYSAFAMHHAAGTVNGALDSIFGRVNRAIALELERTTLSELTARAARALH